MFVLLEFIYVCVLFDLIKLRVICIEEFFLEWIVKVGLYVLVMILL